MFPFKVRKRDLKDEAKIVHILKLYSGKPICLNNHQSSNTQLNNTLPLELAYSVSIIEMQVERSTRNYEIA